ncbi:alpha/beta fold hydrolase [Sphingomonas immobilis]|uniref:Alpha/beta fold hydrolase n=1 Tax=Sphingomonas immobilis TaxID=3063997 RepID=A0ABT8ZZJ0_9SPHN|nr:alpha/beta fold hydrolase [Sphingomonas sp. CA1-15]MDO7842166.1 alpha/beta fold hydrolase [Sphingomonas sp. CA1-15]
MSAVATTDVAANGLRFTCRVRGTDGVPVMLLHGFPETSAMWEPLMTTLVAAGFRCVAPDQRGYSPGARPADIAAYATANLVADMFGIADALGWERFHLVAHDWGAIVAWRAAAERPERLASLTVLSIPHYHAFAEAAWTDPEEEPYRRFLLLTVAPDGAAERVLGRGDMASFRQDWTHHAPEEVALTLGVLRQDGALSAALAWYRASDAHRRVLAEPPAPVAVPTLLIWGRDDPYVRPAALALGERIPVAGYRRVDLDAGHWLAQERPEDIAALVLEQLARHP